MEHGEALDCLLADEGLLKNIELVGPHGGTDARKDKKLREVAGFCDVILHYVRKFLPKKERLRVLECSCGKSYLGIALAVVLRRLEDKETDLVGVDINQELVEKCRRLAGDVGLEHVRYVAGRSVQFQSEEEFDLVLALHACDTATDEAIAKGIDLGARLIMAVPCCQNQIRGQIKSGHPLTAMTEFGPVRYRLANLLTDVLRAQFLQGAGYYVEMQEIGSPRLTPKNLCICARKTRSGPSRSRAENYVDLKELFGVKPAVERLCPGVLERHGF